jgi:nucleoside phosphorylase
MNSTPTIAIFTALQKELRAVSQYVADLEEIRTPDGSFYDVGKLPLPSDVWRIVLCETGAGIPRAGLAVEKCFASFNPNATFFCGVAGGLKDVSIGDVVVGQTVYFYDSVKEGKELQARPTNTLPANERLLQSAMAAAQAFAREYETSGTKPPFNVYVKPIAAGSGLIANARGQRATFIRKFYGDSVALEMEGSSYMLSAHMSNRPALVVRGISDLLSGKSSADVRGSQETAASNAAAFLFRILDKLELDAFKRPEAGTAPTLDWSQLQPILNSMYRRIDALFPPDLIITMSGPGSVAALYCMGLRPKPTPVLVCVTFPKESGTNTEVVAFSSAADANHWFKLKTDKWIIYVPGLISQYPRDSKILIFDDRIITGASQEKLLATLAAEGFTNVKCAAMICDVSEMKAKITIEFKGLEVRGQYFMPWGSKQGRSG